MRYKSVGYHTRLSGQNTVKVCSGSFGGAFDLETVNRLVKHHFTVIARPSGNLCFVDSEGKEVMLYITVDPESTEKGKLVRQELNRKKMLEEQSEDNKRSQLEDRLEGMSLDEALHRLS